MGNPEASFFAPAVAIIIAAFFDGIDGKIARLTKTDSKFGVEYDSLSDLATFGVAPAILMYAWVLKLYGRIGWLAAFLYFACGALRLARFNVSKAKISQKFFQGLPIPAAAGFLAATVLMHGSVVPIDRSSHFYVVIMVYSLAFLMVSNIRYRSFKEINLGGKKSFQTLIIIVLIIIVIAAKPEITLFLIGVTYVVEGIIEEIIFYKKRKLMRETVEKTKIE